MLFLHQPCKNNVDFRITVNETYCAGDKPKCSKQHQKDVYLRVGGGFAAATSTIQIVLILFGASGLVYSTVILINSNSALHFTFT